jgi:type II secretory pathway pseudopilin PulG
MIELLVSISIIVLVLTITLTRQSAFNSAVLLRSEAFDMALAIREVQLSAVSAASDGSGEFRSTLGVHVDTANRNEYILFRDSTSGSDDNNSYDPGEEFGISGSIDPRFEIGTIEAVGVTDPSEVSIVFQRPNYDAEFHSTSVNLTNATAIRIQLQLKGSTAGSCGDQWRIIEITSAGQIAVANCL